MFQLTKDEFNNLRSQIGASSWGGTRYLSYRQNQRARQVSAPLKRISEYFHTNGFDGKTPIVPK